MSLVSIRNVCKQFATQVIFEELSLELHGGQIVGLVGPNGCGKTTLLRLISGAVEPDLGTIQRSTGIRFGYLAQEPQITLDRTLHHEVGSAFDHLLRLEGEIHDVAEQLARQHHGQRYSELSARYDRLTTRFAAEGGYTFTQEMNEILGGLGFSQADHQLPMSALSGGQKCRAALAKLLLSRSDYLLLDEPTNHLDIDACRWLERFLNSYGGAAVIVSHDRYLLDRVVHRIVEVIDRKVVSYPGNYSNYVTAREVRRLSRQRQYRKDQAEIEKEQDYIARYHYAQRARQAQGRRTRLQRRLRQGELLTENSNDPRDVIFDFKPVPAGTGPALTVRGLTKRFDDKVLFDKLNLQVENGERFAITGPNGSGKSTLLKIVLQLLDADAGQFEFGYHVAPGYYAQEPVELQGQYTVLDYIRQACPDRSDVALRSLLGGFEFRGDDVFKPVAALSGGEQSRLRLLNLILSQPSMLILDEPTNHLDIPSRESLEDALQAFPGTVVLVSHDRYLLDRVADRLLVMRPGDCRVFPGNYTFYVDHVEKEVAEARQQQRQQRRQVARQDAVRPPAREPSIFDPMSIDQIEQFIIEHEHRLAELNQQFADSEVYRNPQRLADLQQELHLLKSKLAEAEQHWLQRGEDLN